MSKTTRGFVRSGAKAALQAAAFGVSALALSAGFAAADDDAGDVSGVVVTGEREVLESPKYIAPIENLPQTVTVVNARVIAEQNLLNLRDILSILPGVTFGAGEGGGGYGDSINFRGYSANTDITVDGVRDSAQYSRTDPFNLNQVEVASGSNSVYSGAGAVGGSINLVTKTPMGQDGMLVNAAIGTDNYGRVTLDAEHGFGESVSARLNLMTHANDVPGRDVETFERWGVAPSIAFGIGTPTRFTLAYFHQSDDNIPEYGVPYALGLFNDGPLSGVDESDYFGYSNVDKQEIGVDALTAIFEHEFTDAISVRNLARWQRVTQLSIVDPPQGTWCVGGIDPWLGTACAAPGTYLPSGPRGTLRDTENEVLVNQTDLTLESDFGFLVNTLVAGISFSHETYARENGNVLRNPRGVTPNPVLPVMDISNSNHIYAGPVNVIITNTADGEVSNRAFYLFDRAQFGDHWELNAGVRFEKNEGSVTTATIAVPYPLAPALPVVTQAPEFHNDDNLVSYRVGLVYKPIEDASIYASYATSQTPSLSNVNGTCDIITNCNVEPEEAETIEVGAKWSVLDGSLLLTAAIFRTERTNYRVPSNDPAVPEQQLDGASRVDGLTLGATGQVGENWTILANYTYLDGEILQGVSDFCLANPGATGCVLGGNNNLIVGDPLANTPDHSASLWVTYETDFDLTLGYGVTYQGQISFNRTAVTAPLFKTDPYWVQRLMATYEVTDNFALQLNVNNLFDEDYYERIRNNANNGWATPGAARSATLTAAYRF